MKYLVPKVACDDGDQHSSDNVCGGYQFETEVVTILKEKFLPKIKELAEKHKHTVRSLLTNRFYGAGEVHGFLGTLGLVCEDCLGEDFVVEFYIAFVWVWIFVRFHFY